MTKAKAKPKKEKAVKKAAPKKSKAAPAKKKASKKPPVKPAKKKAAAKPAAPKKVTPKKVSKKVSAKEVKKAAVPKKVSAVKSTPTPKPAPAAKAKKLVPAAAVKAVPKKATPAPTATVKKLVPAAAAKAVPKKTAPAPAAKPKAAPAKAKPAAAGAPPAPASPAPRPQPARSNVKPLTREFLFALGQAIKDAVAPVARSLRGREVVSTATSGDATFELDKVAEKALMTFLKNAKAPIAYYSEDSGYSTFSSATPQNLLIVDPIDGTRAAKSGFEGCVVSIASTRVIERPVIADLDSACVVEIMGDRIFHAERGKGARWYSEGHPKRPKLSQNTNLESLVWSMTVPARPAELIFQTSARLIDLSSLKGGFFACNSSSFSLTRLITEQMDACVDFAPRFMQDIPDLVRDHFVNAGRGVILGVAPYDFAAALLIAQEAGAIVTNAYGRGFENVLLLDSTPANHQSIIAAANPQLHEKLMIFFDTRIKQIEQLLIRRAKAAAATS